MARIEGRDPVYEAADAFQRRCITQNRSLLWPNRQSWTVDNLDAIWEQLIANPDTGDREFLEKWQDQLQPLSVGAHRAGADLMAIFHLYNTAVSAETKLQQVKTVAGWEIAEEPEDLQIVQGAFETGGVGNAGTYYLTNKWIQVGFYTGFARECKQEGVDVSDPAACRLVADVVEDELPQPSHQARHILLHLLFPENFEPIVSNTHRDKIVETFGDMAGAADSEDVALVNIREAFEDQRGMFRPFDFYYDPEIREQWNPGWDPREAADVHTDHEEAVQEAAASSAEPVSVWIEKTHVEGRSDREEGEYALGQVLWSPQTDQRGADIYRFMREVEPGDVVLHLTDNAGITGVSRAADTYEEFDGVEGTEWGTGPSYLVPLEEFKELDPPLPRSEFLSDDYRDRLREARDNSPSPVFYTRGLELRQGAYLTPATPDLVSVLNDAYRNVAGEPLVDQVPVNRSINGSQPAAKERDLDWLQAKTLWPRSRLRELVEDLEDSSPQVVLAGPPGTSKTWVAKHVGRYLTDDQSDRHRTVQFHPSYGYEDFIEGLRPVSDEGSISFKEEKGVLLEMTEEMRDNGREEETHVLVIDEMNRANLPRVFGELMYLFEYRGEEEEIDLQYSEDFYLPEGLKFIATMNTADRSIRSIDIALRRRFDVIECMPEADVIRQYYAQKGHENEVEGLIDGFEALNDQLREEIDKHHQIGHTFFMEPAMDPVQLRKIWDRKLDPLIEEYFFDQPDIAAQYKRETFWPES